MTATFAMLVKHFLRFVCTLVLYRCRGSTLLQPKILARKCTLTTWFCTSWYSPKNLLGGHNLAMPTYIFAYYNSGTHQ